MCTHKHCTTVYTGTRKSQYLLIIIIIIAVIKNDFDAGDACTSLLVYLSKRITLYAVSDSIAVLHYYKSNIIIIISHGNAMTIKPSSAVVHMTCVFLCARACEWAVYSVRNQCTCVTDDKCVWCCVTATVVERIT